jgi:hypothetical protein
MPVQKQITQVGCSIATCPASKTPFGETHGEWDWALWFVKYSPIVDAVLTTFALSFPDPVLLLDLTNTANTLRAKNRLAQHSRLVCTQETIRRCSCESSSPREHFSLLYHVSSPIQPTVCLLCLSSYSLYGICPFQSILLSGHGPHFVLEPTSW